MSTCFIFGASPEKVAPIKAQRGDLVIAADGGYDKLKALGIKPDLLLGDFDSIEAGAAETDAEQLRYPVEKDDTDMLLAVKTGFERGYEVFVIYGGVGGRLDHTLANVQTLAYIARRGGRGYLMGNGFVITALYNDELLLSASKRGNISVFAHGGDARGVTLEGLKYPLKNAVLSCDVPLGVSNSFTGVPSRVSVEDGVVIVYWQERLHK